MSETPMATPRKEKLLLELKQTRALSPDTFLMTLALDSDKGLACRPGQFFNLRPTGCSAPLLRRPISICDTRPDTGEMDLLVRRTGEGTALLTSRPAGSFVDAVGPLGSGFEVDLSHSALMIAGGMGVAPLNFIAGWIRRNTAGNTAPRITFCYGARSKSELVLLDRIETLASRLVTSTDDGSQGQKGYVTDAAEPFLTGDTQIFICGPSQMMDVSVKMLHARNLHGQLSLENQMGCGVGACQGCVVPGRRGMIRVCCDGPVVSSDLLDFVFVD